MDVRIRFGVPGAEIRYRKDVRVVEQGVPLSRSAIWPLAATRTPPAPPAPPPALRDAWFRATGREPIVAPLRGLAIDALRHIGGRWVEYKAATLAPIRCEDPPAPADLDSLRLGYDWYEVVRPRYDDPRLEALLERPIHEAMLAVPIGAIAALDAMVRALPTLVVVPGPGEPLADPPDLQTALSLPPDPRALAMVAHASGHDVRLGPAGLCVLIGARFDQFDRVAAAAVG